jgi:hypothetical protein
MVKKLDLIGQVFGRLTVVKEADPYVRTNGKKERKWLCQCSCNNIKEVLSHHLTGGNTKSCGCLKKEIISNRNFKHGCALRKNETKEYRAFRTMKARCLNSNNPFYKDYGGRGIKICNRWLHSEHGFENFLEDMSYAPSSKHTLDRIDVNGNYEPSNCRWATQQVQAINQRTAKNNTSRHKGIYWNKASNKWRARITTNNKLLHLGYFTNIDEAITARLEAEEIYHKPLLNN